jgi:putative ABC transport system permease protein
MMNLLSQLWRRLLSLLRRGRYEREMEEEMRFHLEMQVEQNLTSGMAPEEAQYAARRQFGNQTWLKEVSREMWSLNSIETLIQDLRYGARMLLKNPGFTLIAVLTLALGIGANTAIFSVINAILLKPLRYPQSDLLVQIWQTNPRANRWGEWISYPAFVDYRMRNRVFEDTATYRPWLWNMTGGDRPEALLGARVTSNLFSVLGVQPMLGRSFLPEEDQPGRSQVVILSHGLWLRRFGSDPGVVGKVIVMDGQNYTVVGVMPPGFDLPYNVPASTFASDIWTPPGDDQEREDRGSPNYRVLARLKPGVSIRQAQADLETVARGIGEQHPENREMSAMVVGLQQNLVKESRPTLLLLLGAVGLVLLIACANVANLQLTRATARQKEAAIRFALGAGRLRLIRQLLTESLLLALLGGVAGLLLAVWGVGLLVKLGPDLPSLQEVSIAPRVVGFALVLSLATGVIFGMAPAFQGSRINLNETLKESGARAQAGTGRGRTRSLLVIAQMALALTLLVSAGLLIQSFIRLQKVDPGFNPRGVLMAYLMLPSAKYAEPGRQAAFLKEAIGQIEASPGVESAGGASAVPLSGWNDAGYFSVEGRPWPGPGEPVIDAEQPKITPEYFRAMGIPVLKGRAFTWADNENSPDVAIVSEDLVRRYWPDEDPIGKRLSINNRNGQPVWRQVVGVVKDVKHDALTSPIRPAIYVPVSQLSSTSAILAVRARTDPAGLVAAIRRAVTAADNEQPVLKLTTIERSISDSASQRRFQTQALTVFAAVALTLAAIGIYGVMAYTVSRRTHEIGIRVALGAPRRDILRMIVIQGMRLTLIGVVIGLAGALALARLMKGLLFGVSATDPLTYALIALLLTIVALLACWIPARRATKVDPMTALRVE